MVRKDVGKVGKGFKSYGCLDFILSVIGEFLESFEEGVGLCGLIYIF